MIRKYLSHKYCHLFINEVNKMKKILVAIDESKHALKALDFINQLFSGSADVEITLFHVIKDYPPAFWDDGHYLNAAERSARREVIEKWQSNQRLKLESVFKLATERLENAGFNKNQITTKSIDSTYVVIADRILEEASNGGYQMLVMGRHGYTSSKKLIMGSVSNAVLSQGSALAVCIVR